MGLEPDQSTRQRQGKRRRDAGGGGSNRWGRGRGWGTCDPSGGASVREGGASQKALASGRIRFAAAVAKHLRLQTGGSEGMDTADSRTFACRAWWRETAEAATRGEAAPGGEVDEEGD
jgi:hypothetical protein